MLAALRSLCCRKQICTRRLSHTPHDVLSVYLTTTYTYLALRFSWLRLSCLACEGSAAIEHGLLDGLPGTRPKAQVFRQREGRAQPQPGGEARVPPPRGTHARNGILYPTKTPPQAFGLPLCVRSSLTHGPLFFTAEQGCKDAPQNFRSHGEVCTVVRLCLHGRATAVCWM